MTHRDDAADLKAALKDLLTCLGTPVASTPAPVPRRAKPDATWAAELAFQRALMPILDRDAALSLALAPDFPARTRAFATLQALGVDFNAEFQPTWAACSWLPLFAAVRALTAAELAEFLATTDVDIHGSDAGCSSALEFAMCFEPVVDVEKIRVLLHYGKRLVHRTQRFCTGHTPLQEVAARRMWLCPDGAARWDAVEALLRKHHAH
jgi:hypothetical protein